MGKIEKDERFVDAKSFGERLKLLRIRKGYDVATIADLVGVHRSTFSGYETQEKFPPIEKLTRIAHHLGTSTDYLIGLTDDPAPINSPKELRDYMQQTKGLHWDGIPLTEEQLKPLADLFNHVVHSFIKQYDKNDDKNGTDHK